MELMNYFEWQEYHSFKNRLFRLIQEYMYKNPPTKKGLCINLTSSGIVFKQNCYSPEVVILELQSLGYSAKFEEKYISEFDSGPSMLLHISHPLMMDL